MRFLLVHEISAREYTNNRRSEVINYQIGKDYSDITCPHGYVTYRLSRVRETDE
jgi:hypothetical protein